MLSISSFAHFLLLFFKRKQHAKIKVMTSSSVCFLLAHDMICTSWHLNRNANNTVIEYKAINVI